MDEPGFFMSDDYNKVLKSKIYFNIEVRGTSQATVNIYFIKQMDISPVALQ